MDWGDLGRIGWFFGEPAALVRRRKLGARSRLGKAVNSIQPDRGWQQTRAKDQV